MRQSFRFNIADTDEIDYASKLAVRIYPEIRKQVDLALQELRGKIREKLASEFSSYKTERGTMADTWIAKASFVRKVGFGVEVQSPDEAWYAEFGTGMVGASSHHPDRSFGKFNGYTYRPTWLYVAKQGHSAGIKRVTEGQVAKPAFYHTYRYAISEGESTINKYLSRVVL